MRLLMRQASGAPNVAELARAYTEHNLDTRALAFCTDVASPEKLWQEGGMDAALRVAVRHGLPPVTAIQAATVNVAEVFNLQHDIGSIAPGRFADLVLVEDLAAFSIDRVLVNGRVVVDGGACVELPPTAYPGSFYNTVRLPRAVQEDDLLIRADSPDATVQVRAIGVTDGSFLTRERLVTVAAVDGVLQADPAQDVLFIAMADRFEKGPGRISTAFVSGFGLKHGAIASSANSVCENLIAIGASAADIALAFNTLATVGGGKVIVDQGEVLALVELPILGLLSEDTTEIVNEKFARAIQAVRELGCELQNPFSQLEFCFASGEMGEIKLSDEGLFITAGDVRKVPVVV